jgi:hypothetical protein
MALLALGSPFSTVAYPVTCTCVVTTLSRTPMSTIGRRKWMPISPAITRLSNRKPGAINDAITTIAD